LSTTEGRDTPTVFAHHRRGRSPLGRAELPEIRAVATRGEGNERAAERVRALLLADALAVSVVTVYEMLAEPTTAPEALDFWRRFFDHVEVVPVLAVVGELGTAGARAANGMAAADGLISASAAAYGRSVLTADKGFGRYPGIDVECVEPLRHASN
jgi:predicted nucleic acid-binding protein